MAADEFLDMISDLKGELESKIVIEEIHKKVFSTFDLDEIIQEITTNVCSLLNCERATVYVVERGATGEGRELVSRYLIGDEVNEIRVPYDIKSVAGAAACSGRTICVKDVYNSEELAAITPNTIFNKSWDEKTGYRTKSMLVVPAKKNDYIVGLIQALNKNGEEFDSEDISVLSQMSDLLTQAVTTERGVTRTMRRSRTSVNDLMISKGLISDIKLKEAIERSKTEKIKLIDILMQHYDLSEEDICRTLSEYNEVEFKTFDPEEMIDPGLFDILTEGFAKQHLVCPLKLVMEADGSKVINLVMHNPKDFVAIEDVEIRLGAKVRDICMATRSDVLAMIRHCLHPEQAMDESQESMGDLLTELSEELGIQPEEKEIETVNIQEGATEDEGPIVRLGNRVIEEAVRKGATDIHVEPKEHLVLVRYRVDGSLEKALTFPAHAKNAIVSRYKIMAECNITEHRIPQDGRIRFKQFGGRYDVELRVNFLPTVGGNEDVVMRILADSKPLPLDKMGFMPYSFAPMVESVNKPYGMILCVGPTGSGKTTTLHSAVSYINTPDRKILTAEDPVEITQDGLRQVQIKKEVGLDFSATLRAFLRQDPDVILVGEMRDFETCSIAIEAALTGHLLLSTLHTNNAPETVTRLVDIGIDPVTLSDALLLVLAQRLAKTLCGKCKEIYEPEEEELEEAGFVKNDAGILTYLEEEYPDATFYKPVGCTACQDRGYKGRMGVHEALQNTDTIKRLIATKAKIAEIREAAKAQGMHELYEDGMIKVMNGKTSIQQIRTVCVE